MTGGALITYQSMKEGALLNAAISCQLKGDIYEANMYMIALGCLLGLNPKTPAVDFRGAANAEALKENYFTMLKEISTALKQNIDGIRSSYGNPFEMKPKGKNGKGAPKGDMDFKLIRRDA
jgi:hypothetical protein